MSRDGVQYFGEGKYHARVAKTANIGNGSLIDCQGQVTIGEHVFFGHRVMVLTGLHDYMKFGVSRMHTRTSRPVTIEDGAWIASGAIIYPGVTVGKHAVVAAGAVVTRNVPPYTLVAGNPAQRIRRLRSKDAEAPSEEI